jgi:hypothetical protein
MDASNLFALLALTQSRGAIEKEMNKCNISRQNVIECKKAEKNEETHLL